MIAKGNAKCANTPASIWACDAQICVICKNATIQQTAKKMTTKLFLTLKQIMTTNRKVMIEKSQFLLIFLFNCTVNNETIERNILLL